MIRTAGRLTGSNALRRQTRGSSARARRAIGRRGHPRAGTNAGAMEFDSMQRESKPA